MAVLLGKLIMMRYFCCKEHLYRCTVSCDRERLYYLSAWSTSTIRRLSLRIPVCTLLQLRKSTKSFFGSDNRQAMAHDERSLYVSLSCCTRFSLQIRMHNSVFAPAGNSSLLLITNGASFGDVAPIGGRYWSVAL